MNNWLCMTLTTAFLVGTVFDYAVTGRRVVKNECLCKQRTVTYLDKKIAKYARTLPRLSFFKIPIVKKRFDHSWKNALKDLPITIPWVDPFWRRMSRNLKDERYPCTTSTMTTIDRLRFPRIKDFVQCRKTRLRSAGTCMYVSEPGVVLRIKNPRQRGRKCRYVPIIDWRVVGCSWVPDKPRKLNEYNVPK